MDFITETVSIQWNAWKKRFAKESCCNAKAKEHYQSFMRQENTKSVKQSKITNYQPKAFENINFAEIKSVITEHPKSSQILSKTINQAEKVGSNSSLYNDIKKSEN